MELTRRDALVAVGASTSGIAAAGEIVDRFDEPSRDVSSLLTRLAAAAQVVYPSEIEVTESFLRTYVIGRESNQSEYIANARTALDELDQRSRRRFDASFTELSEGTRDKLLRQINIPDVAPLPDGTALERIRYYVVNELLYALYTSPTGGQLLGSENPPGHPGGRSAYQQGPTDE